MSLSCFGYLGSISGLLQYTIVQSQTPDHMLGRINSLWTAQNMIGDSAGVLGIGLLLKVLSPIAGLITLGLSCSIISLLIGYRSDSLRKVDLTLSSTEEK